jgi:methionyl aminopeptidase
MSKEPESRPSAQDLDALRAAGRVAAAVRGFGARMIIAGARPRDVCAAVEDEIRRRGAHPAFPTQSARNHVAAHDCPAPEDDSVYERGDLAKLDIGVHVDGWVVDTATTVNVGDVAPNRPKVEAVRAALSAAIAASGPGVPVARISRAIETAIRSFGLRPLRNLCGHGVGRFLVHCPPPIPNLVEEPSRDVLHQGHLIALEPFATDGEGVAREEGAPEVFRLAPEAARLNDVDADVFEAIRAFRGLPFSRRDLARFPPARVRRALLNLRRERAVLGYAPLVERSRGAVAQAEHTIYVGASGIEVLTE